MVLTREEQRWAIIESWKSMGQDESAAAKKLGLRLRTVKTWVRKYQDDGNVEPRPKTGRKQALSEPAAIRAHALLLDESMDGANMVALKLQEEGMTTKLRSKNTIIRAARRVGVNLGHPIVARRGKPRKQLTEKNKEQRLDFCRQNLDRDWDHVMITDRKKFLFQYPGAKVKAVQWLEKGQQWEARKVNHAEGVNVYAGLTSYGVTSMHEVTGTSRLTTNFKTLKGQKSRSISQSEYMNVLEGTFLREGTSIFKKQGVEPWVLQQDGDGAHNRAGSVIASWNRQHGATIGILPKWPPNSPDLSPIENLWSWTQNRINARGCKTFDEFKAAVKEEWSHITPAMAARYMSSIPKRLKDCLKANGKMTNY
jgi:transposase